MKEGREEGPAHAPRLSLSVLPEPESNAVNQSVERGHRAHRHERRISAQWGKSRHVLLMWTRMAFIRMLKNSL